MSRLVLLPLEAWGKRAIGMVGGLGWGQAFGAYTLECQDCVVAAWPQQVVLTLTRMCAAEFLPHPCPPIVPIARRSKVCMHSNTAPICSRLHSCAICARAWAMPVRCEWHVMMKWPEPFRSQALVCAHNARLTSSRHAGQEGRRERMQEGLELQGGALEGVLRRRRDSENDWTSDPNSTDLGRNK